MTLRFLRRVWQWMRVLFGPSRPSVATLLRGDWPPRLIDAFFIYQDWASVLDLPPPHGYDCWFHGMSYHDWKERGEPDEYAR